MTKKVIGTLIIAGCLLPLSLFGQDAGPTSASNSLTGWMIHHIVIVMGLLVFIGALAFLFSSLRMLLKQKEEEFLEANGIVVEESHRVKKESWIERQISGLSGLKPMEQEAALDLHHDYDGIRELDNSLPPWWLYLFYFTIAWAVGYLYIYQFSDIGKSAHEEYYADMKIAEEKRADFLFKQANLVNENNVKVLTDEAALLEAHELFIANCMACHGAEGQGGIGPNFADKYWIHGGSINDIFKVIKYGVPEKGMISWKTQLSPAAMQKLASYIIRLQDTNPPNQKKSEGELYEPESTSSES